MATTYTPQGGYNPITQQQEAGQKLLLSLKSQVSPQAYDAISGAYNSSNQATTDTANLPAFTQQQTTGANQIAQLPQATGTYGNMADMYKMFVADYQKNLQGSMRPDMQQPGTPTQQASDVPTYGSVGAPVMPELTPQSLKQGFQGFTNPTTAASAQNLEGSGIIGTLGNLSNLIGYNAGEANTQISQNVGEEQARINAEQMNSQNLLQLFSILNSQQSSPQAIGTNATQDVQSGMTLKNLFTKYVDKGLMDATTAYRLYNQFNYTDAQGNKTGYGSPTESLGQLDNMGIKLDGLQSKKLSDGTMINFDPKTGQYYDQSGKPVDSQKTHLDAIKGFGDLMRSYYGGSVDIAGARSILDPNQRGKFEAMKKVYIGQLQKSLGIGRGKYNMETLMSSIPDENFSLGAEGQFQGHLQSLLNNSGLIMIKDKKTGSAGIVDENSFDPSTEDKLDVQATPGETLMNILTNL